MGIFAQISVGSVGLIFLLQSALDGSAQTERPKLEISRQGSEVLIQWQSQPQQMSWLRSWPTLGGTPPAGRLLISPTGRSVSVRSGARDAQEFFRLSQFRPIHAPSYEARLENRTPLAADILQRQAVREQAVQQMRNEIGIVNPLFDPVSGRALLTTWETLSPPLDPLPEDSQTVVKAFLDRWRLFFGYGAEVLESAELIEDTVSPTYGTRSLVWVQKLEGIPVFQGFLSAEMTSRDALLWISVLMVGDPAVAADRGLGTDHRRVVENPPVSAAQAVATAGYHLGEEITSEDVQALDLEPEGATQKQHFRAAALVRTVTTDLSWLTDRGRLRLAWVVDLMGRSSSGVPFIVMVDAQTGEVLARYTMAAE